MQQLQNLENIQKNLFISVNRQQQRSEEGETFQKKRKRLILKRIHNKVPLLLNYSYVFKVSQNIIINERALKQGSECNESFMASIFYFKSIRSIKLDESYVSLSLKQTQKNQFPISYYTDRFKSFGDNQFYELAKTLETLDLECSKRVEKTLLQINQEQQKKTLRIQLQDVLNKYTGKMTLILYSQPTGTHVSLNKMIISTELLQALGYKPEQISKEFLRYRHVFFQIFDSSLYRQIINKANKSLRKCVIDNSNFNELTFNDYIFRVRLDQRGYYQQKLKAEIIYSRPCFNVSVYEISKIDENEVVQIVPRKSVKCDEAVKEWEQKLIHQEITNLRNMKYNNLQQIFQS